MTKATPLTTFTDLGLAPELLRALDTEGYTVPTPIQGKAIPPVLSGRDLLGIAQTGTGKTAAFALPILHRLAANRRPAPRKGCRVLVLSPTRELASQIAESFRAYGRHLGFSVTTVFGGVGHRPQISALARGVDILVATPGRLIDHLEERNAVLDTCEVLVLDEADQMLDLGFVKPIRRIVKSLPQVRQNLFFSATMPKEIGELAAELLRDPARISVVPPATTAERVTQSVIHVEASRKRALLVELLGDPAMARTLVFTRTKRGADRVAKHLETAGLPAAAIHGNKSQRQRELALDAFKSGEVRTLVATDIAARGIDVDAVTHVVNYELPEVPENYVHRIGRTARAGAGGIALSLCDGEERELLRDIERVTRQKIPSSDRRGDPTLTADAPRPHRAERGPRGGRDQEQRQGGQRAPSHERQNGRSQHARPEGQHYRSEGARPEGERAERGDHRPPRQGDRAANGHQGRPGRRPEREGREEVWSNYQRPGQSRSGPSGQGQSRSGPSGQGQARRGDRPQNRGNRQGNGGRAR